ncbi:hypothetical protein BGZ95_007738 [Linnemannia exigua]|uniref:REM-1 domain-containing protein n=1 Tax=Linnemannia exigua TaxID=604196 RepID=A0AAD4H6Q9_9FUNG|nr:hypothetical protein BGZ95_007738 [Linnemannia exigua]
MADSYQSRIQEITRKLQTEQRVKDATTVMRTRHTNPTAIAQCEITLQESQKRIDYLTKEIEKLQIRQSHQQQQQRIQHQQQQQQQQQHQNQHQHQQQQHQHQKPNSFQSHDYASVSDSSMDPILTGEDDYKDRDLVSNSGVYLAGDFGPVPVIQPSYGSVTGSTVSLSSGTTMDSPHLDQALQELPKRPAYTNLGK